MARARTGNPCRLFTVEGTGEFPYDMLRYDQCWPHYSEDASALGSPYTAEERRSRRRVVLECAHDSGPCEERWASFTWRVVERGMPNAETRRVPA